MSAGVSQSAAVLKRGDGTQNIGRANTTLEQSLQGIESVSEGAQNIVLDMHFGALKGLGFVDGESGGEHEFNVTAPAAKGAMSISFDNASVDGAFTLSNQTLFVYKSSDGFFRIGAIDTIDVGVINLREPLEAPIDVGVNITNFWSNESHPNPDGYRALTDYAILNAKALTLAYRSNLIAHGNPNLSVNALNVVNNIGSASTLAYNLSANTAGNVDGVKIAFKPVKTGAYIARIYINTYGQDVRLRWSSNDGYGVNKTTSNNTPSFIDFPVFVRDAISEIDILVTLPVTGETVTLLDKIDVFSVDAGAVNLNRGKHVLLGDSWFAQQGDVQDPLRHLEVMPNAVVINEGVGGEKASDLINRFDTDVSPHKPDFVWLMVGTNDIYAGVDAELFNFYINRLKAKIAEIGARAIVYTPYVGSAGLSAARFDLARYFAANTSYINQVYDLTPPAAQTISIQPVTVPAGELVVLAELGRFENDSFRVFESNFSHAVEVQEKSDLDGAGATVETLPSSNVQSSITVTHTENRYMQLVYDNTVGGSPVTVRGYMVIERDKGQQGAFISSAPEQAQASASEEIIAVPYSGGQTALAGATLKAHKVDKWVDLTGTVNLTGSSSSNALLAILPAGYRPDRLIYFVCGDVGGAVCYVKIAANGEIRLSTTESASALCMDSIRFRVDQSE